MKRYGISSIAASSALVTGIAVMAHETAHVLSGRLAGGVPTVMTATEVRGDFTGLSGAGFVAFGLAGSIVNLLLCALGWWALGREPATDELRLSAWFCFAINGMLATTKMMAEPLIGIGDWMTVLRPFHAPAALRGAVAALGLLGVAFLVRRTGTALGRLIEPGTAAQRTSEALRIVGVGAIASTVLLLGGCVASPVGPTRAVVLGLGAGMGPFLPIAFGIRFVRRADSGATVPRASLGWPWYLVPVATTLVVWFIVGPGLPLWRAPLA